MGGKYRDKIFGVAPIPAGEWLLGEKKLEQTWQITLTNSEDQSINFIFRDKLWVITEPCQDRADQRYVNTLVAFTQRLQVRDSIPREELNLEDFGLRDGHIRVTMRNKSGNEICDYRIGRQTAWHAPSADNQTTQPTIFVRLADDDLKDNIYVCSLSPGRSDTPKLTGNDDIVSSIHALFDNQFSRFRDHHPLHFSPTQLERIRIQNTEGELLLSRDNLQSGWGIAKPLELPVDPVALKNLLSDLSNLSATEIQDRGSVTLPAGESDTAQAQEISIHSAGADDDIVLRVYPPVKEGDTTVLATVSDRPDTIFHLPLTATSALPDTTPLSALQVGANDLRSKTMTQLSGPQLKTIIVRPQGRIPVMLQRSKKTIWQVLRPSGWERTNQGSVIDLLTAVSRDQVEKFVTDAATDLSIYGLDTPFLQIAFISFNDEGMRIAFGRDPDGKHVFAHIVGLPNIWQISTDTLSKIAQDSWQWRDPLVWHLPKVDVSNITIQKPAQPTIQLDYDHFAANWEASYDKKNATAALNPNRAEKFLSEIQSLVTKRWLGPLHPQAMQALENPNITISVTVQQVDDEAQNSEPVVKTLRVATTPGGFIHFAKIDTTPQHKASPDESSYFLLDPKTVTQLNVNLFE